MRPVVYLGPSLPRSEAARILDADYKPPVRRGDLPALDDDVSVIGIIDGVFMGEAAVGHREIINKLRSGVRVFGAGSMGALRAAELQDFGMVGVGMIFNKYLAREIDGDDEVALIFNPETLEPLSEPLINMRLNLEKAVGKGILARSDAMKIISCLKSKYFPKRTMAALRDCMKDALASERYATVAETFENDYSDYKREDAIELLSTIAKIAKVEFR